MTQSIVVALQQKPEYNVLRMTGQCLRCKGNSKVGHILCRECFTKVLSGEMSNRPEVVNLSRQINELERPTVWQPMGIKMSLVKPNEKTGIRNCPNCNKRQEGDEVSCLRCKHTLVANIGFVNCRVGEIEFKGPDRDKQIFVTQKQLGDFTWEKNTGAPGKSRLANMRPHLDRARAENGVINPRDGDIIARYGRNVKRFRVDESLKKRIDHLRQDRVELVERLFFEFWFAGSNRIISGSTDSVRAKAKINSESVKETSIVASRQLEVPLP